MPRLFSYGDLQREDVQLSTFGRRLHGQHDELVGFERALVRIEDPQVVAAIGKTHHANAAVSTNAESRMPGMVFEMTDGELARADAFEVSFSYRRVVAMLASGGETWVYVHAPTSTDGS